MNGILKLFDDQWQKPRVFVPIGLLLFGLVFGGYRYYVKNIQSLNYRIFDYNPTVTWEEGEEGIRRKDAQATKDNILLSRDRWREFDLSFDLVHPRDCGLAFGFDNIENFSFIYFNKESQSIIWGIKKNGVTKGVVKEIFSFQDRQKCRLTLKDGKVQLSLNNLSFPQFPLNFKSGQFGLILNEAQFPLTSFHHFSIAGRLEGGRSVQGRSPPQFSGSPLAFILFLLPLYFLLLVLSFYFSRVCEIWGAPSRAGAAPGKRHLNTVSAALVHLFLAVCLFWPFFSQGKNLISSFDNVGEIYPFFFYSKHVFKHFLETRTLDLWNPLAHNGVPFFSNHWNMLYYPPNWILFLAPDRLALGFLTFKTFLEVFLTGLLAYGFFSREIHSREWGLFASIAYQMGSFLIFSFTVFPTTALYMTMTLYLYLLWSMPQRRAVWNYFLLSLSIVLVLTSTNMAFVFYALVALAAISLYRCFSLNTAALANLAVVAGGFLTGLLISAVRVLPCLWGVAASNRLVDNYYTLHNRLGMISRLLIPEITGWFGPGAFNALVSPNLNLFFQETNLPSNSQNTFFVYYGILTAILILASLFIRARGKLAFWKYYAWTTIAMSLFVHPFWGILCIMFFPLIHFSYHGVILPVGICALAGHTGRFLESRQFNHKTLGRQVVMLLFVLQCYLLVFLTYLFPPITAYTRLIFFFMLSGCGVAVLIKKFRRDLYRPNLSYAILIFNALVWILVVISTSAVLLRPIPKKEWLGEWATAPFLMLLSALVTGMFIYTYVARRVKRLSLQHYLAGGMALAVPVAAGWRMSTEVFQQLLNLAEPVRVYMIDLLLAHTKFFLIAQLGFLSLALLRVKLLSQKFVMRLFLLVLAVDLLLFNYRFDAVTAPFTTQKAFFAADFFYKDIDPKIKAKMDLTNYRVSSLHRADLNANKNLVFDLPTYTGTVGYMPKRFSDLLIHFGYPPNTVLLYPSDETGSERLLDLSCVRYIMTGETTLAERPTALARLSLFSHYEIIEQDRPHLQRLAAPAFNPQTTVLLFTAPGFPSVDRPAKPIGISDGQRDGIKARVYTDRPAVVLFNESFDSGWKAYLDGQKIPVLLANYNFMAVTVPAGGHQLEFRFHPESFFVSLRLTITGLLILSAVVVFGLWRKRK